jgi:flagellar protein FliO/FliZ
MSKPITILVYSVLLSISLPAVALEETNQRSEFAIGTMLGSLLLVLACIFFFAFLMKKSNLIRYGHHKNPIKVIATHPLTNKSRIQIIEVNGKQYLLGVSEQSINLLDQWQQPLSEGTGDCDQKTPPTFASAFASVLSKVGKKTDE